MGFEMHVILLYGRAFVCVCVCVWILPVSPGKPNTNKYLSHWRLTHFWPNDAIWRDSSWSTFADGTEPFSLLFFILFWLSPKSNLTAITKLVFRLMNWEMYAIKITAISPSIQWVKQSLLLLIVSYRRFESCQKFSRLMIYEINLKQHISNGFHFPAGLRRTRRMEYRMWIIALGPRIWFLGIQLKIFHQWLR